MEVKEGVEKFVGGLGVAAVCLTLYFSGLVHQSWIVILAIIFGVLPVIKGLKHIASSLVSRPRLSGEVRAERKIAAKPVSAQKAILRLAKEHRGVVTPALVSVETSVELEAAAKELETMAAKGYAEMRVRENGVIEYLFPEFDVD